MGLDFAAFLQYRGPTGDALDAIAELESDRDFPVLREVIECGRRFDFAFADRAGDPARWRFRDDWHRAVPGRPALPTLTTSLCLPSGFDLTFGPDAIVLCHHVRWMCFLELDDWHPVLLDAVELFCTLFDAMDCIITNDEHPAILRFRDGSTYWDSIDYASTLGEGEVATIKEMFIDNGFAEEIVFQNPDGTCSEIPLWDTKGFWRPVRAGPRPN